MNAIVDALIVFLMTIIAMMAILSLLIVVVGALWQVLTGRDESPIDDKTYDWRHMRELRTRFENRDQR